VLVCDNLHLYHVSKKVISVFFLCITGGTFNHIKRVEFQQY
jgi:hypothetical protein